MAWRGKRKGSEGRVVGVERYKPCRQSERKGGRLQSEGAQTHDHHPHPPAFSDLPEAMKVVGLPSSDE